MGVKLLYGGLGKHAAEVLQMRIHAKSKSTADELALMRLILNKILARAQTDDELIAQSPAIKEILATITTLVNTTVKLDALSGETLDKAQIQVLADALAACIQRNVPDDTIKQALQKDMLNTIGQVLDGTYEQTQPIQQEPAADVPDAELAERMAALDIKPQ